MFRVDKEVLEVLQEKGRDTEGSIAPQLEFEAKRTVSDGIVDGGSSVMVRPHSVERVLLREIGVHLRRLIHVDSQHGKYNLGTCDIHDLGHFWTDNRGEQIEAI